MILYNKEIVIPDDKALSGKETIQDQIKTLWIMAELHHIISYNKEIMIPDEIHQDRPQKRENFPNQNSLGSASSRASTERGKAKKNLFFCFYTDRPSPRVD
jgi:hypothetical protein